ncbi:MAG TPA: 4Fe-4S dicluster domain-containing protein [Candidatus Binatia bacterium]|nr:4Fe-4S dicluster domain-containing protein [Candidatus Binatia bacterium]
MADPVLAEMVHSMGLGEAPHYAAVKPTIQSYRRRWVELAPYRDGEIETKRVEIGDPAEMTRKIKAKAVELGANMVGICRLQPHMIDLGADVPHEFVIACCVAEDYDKVMQGADAVEEEAMRTYVRCTEISNDLAAQIRAMGYPARAHHNGGSEVQAIPIFYQVGFGELGRHGSLINEEYGASFRPGFVTTDLSLVEDKPREFGVQDFCMNCNVCQLNCPGDAIPQDHVVTHGIKRWLIDLEKCYPYSRLRDEYCHLCVDVCPYNVKSHPHTYRAFMKQRKQVGYKTPKSQ